MCQNAPGWSAAAGPASDGDKRAFILRTEMMSVFVIVMVEGYRPEKIVPHIPRSLQSVSLPSDTMMYDEESSRLRHQTLKHTHANSLPVYLDVPPARHRAVNQSEWRD